MIISQQQFLEKMLQDEHSRCDGKCQRCKDAMPQKGYEVVVCNRCGYQGKPYVLKIGNKEIGEGHICLEKEVFKGWKK